MLLIISASFSCGKDDEPSTSTDTSKTNLLLGEWSADGTAKGVVDDDGTVEESTYGGFLITFDASGEVTAWVDDEGDNAFEYLTNPEFWATTYFRSFGTISSSSVVKLYVSSSWSSTTSAGLVNDGVLQVDLVGTIDADGRIITLTGNSTVIETEYGSSEDEITMNLEKQ
jgi:hypothetical protein